MILSDLNKLSLSFMQDKNITVSYKIYILSHVDILLTRSALSVPYKLYNIILS